MDIDKDVKAIQPLLTPRAYRHLKDLQDHRHAPKWNYKVGDKLKAQDLEKARQYRVQQKLPPERFPASLPEPLLSRFETLQKTSFFYKEHLKGHHLSKDFHLLPTMSREDLATSLPEIVPTDVDFDGLIAYDTSGTTGHAITVPTHPRTLAKAQILCEGAMRAYGLSPKFAEGEVACINVGTQQNTYVFTSAFAVWNHAIFAKVNLREAEWPQGQTSAQVFFADANPKIISSDPVGIAEIIRWELPLQPEIIFSTALALNEGFRAQIEERFQCPVVDWYSITETGPIGFTAPDKRGYRPFTDDLYLEVLDLEGLPVSPGQWGEITVTCCRNDYLPLLRYRTGDRGRLMDGRLIELEGRQAVYFEATDGSPVNPVDIARILRLYCTFVQHQFRQRADGSCLMTIRPLPGTKVDVVKMKELLLDLFGPEQDLEVVLDEDLGSSGKVIPYIRE